jgi:hypothetical protein
VLEGEKIYLLPMHGSATQTTQLSSLTGDGQVVALCQLAESRDSNTDRSVDIFPVTKELLVRQAPPSW